MRRMKKLKSADITGSKIKGLDSSITIAKKSLIMYEMELSTQVNSIKAQFMEKYQQAKMQVDELDIEIKKIKKEFEDRQFLNDVKDNPGLHASIKPTTDKDIEAMDQEQKIKFGDNKQQEALDRMDNILKDGNEARTLMADIQIELKRQEE